MLYTAAGTASTARTRSNQADRGVTVYPNEIPEARCLSSPPRRGPRVTTTDAATAAVRNEATTEPTKAGRRHHRARPASASARATVPSRTAKARGITSASPPEQHDQAHDERDDIGEVGVEAAGLDHLHP